MQQLELDGSLSSQLALSQMHGCGDQGITRQLLQRGLHSAIGAISINGGYS